MKNQKTIQQILAMLHDAEIVNRNTLTNCLPPKAELVGILAARGIVSQVTNQVVTEADWRDTDFDTKGDLDCMYVMLDELPDSTTPTVFACFDYTNNDFSYC